MPKLDWRELAAIFAGGFLGALARVLLLQIAPARPGSWPWATFVANLAGTLLLGFFVTRLQERLPVSAYRRPLLGTGLCGALTTFSTMQLEVLRMLDGGRHRWGFQLLTGRGVAAARAPRPTPAAGVAGPSTG